MSELIPPGAEMIQVTMPMPAPILGTQTEVSGVNIQGKAYVRLGFVSPAYGALFVHVPAEVAQTFADAVLSAAATARTGLVLVGAAPDLVTP